MAVITLLTDFGNGDEYVGVMKGVMLSVNPKAVPVDITHRIDPQDLVQAAYVLKACYRFFPPETVHVVVVDPGVGSGRGIIALKMAGFYFLAPDNGVLSCLFDEVPVDKAFRVENSEFFLKEISRTFHGRDIFAPLAGHISRGTALDRLGQEVNIRDLKRLEFPGVEVLPDSTLKGAIISVDHFGNLITNIDAGKIESLCSGEPGKIPATEIGGNHIEGLSESYAGVEDGRPLMIIGSRNLLEISVNKGNASQFLGKKKKDTIRVYMKVRNNRTRLPSSKKKFPPP